MLKQNIFIISKVKLHDFIMLLNFSKEICRIYHFFH